MTADLGRKTALLLVACLTVMSAATVAPALPRMAEAFSAAPNAELLSKLVLTAPAIAIALCAPFAGALVDRFGRVGILRASLVLYGAAGAAGYVLDDLYAILASRAALGVAVAGTMTSVTALVGDYYSGEARTRYAGLQSLAMSLGAVVSSRRAGCSPTSAGGCRFSSISPAGRCWSRCCCTSWSRDARVSRWPRTATHRAFPLGPIAAAYGITFFAVAMFYMIPVQTPVPAAHDRRRVRHRRRGRGRGGVAHRRGRLRVVRAPAAVGRRARRVRMGVRADGRGYALAGLAGTFAGALAGAAVAGVGVGLFFPNSNLWVLALAPPASRGQLAGGLTSAIFLAQFFSPILVHPLVAATSLARAFTIAAVLMGLAAAALALLRGRA